MHLMAVERSLDRGRNGPNFSCKLLLDAVEVVPIVVRNQIYGEAKVPKTTGAPDAMKIRF